MSSPQAGWGAEVRRGDGMDRPALPSLASAKCRLPVDADRPTAGSDRRHHGRGCGLALALAFGITSGLGAAAGLITAVVAGTVAAVFGEATCRCPGQRVP